MKPRMALIVSALLGSLQIACADSLSFKNLNIPGIPFGMNNPGQIVGTSAGGQQTTGYLYTNGVMQTLVAPGASNTFAYGINDTAEVVGAANAPSVGTYAIVYLNGSFTTLTVPWQGSTTARGINNAGHMVGYHTDPAGNTIGFLTAGAGVFTDIIVPGAFSTFPYRVNNIGEVVGYFTNEDGDESGFVYKDGVYQTITVPGSSDTLVYAMNDSGEIVGSFIDNSGTHGFLDDNGVFTTFDAPDTLPTRGTFARDITDDGVILVYGVGTGTFVATSTIESVPEPTAFSLVMCASAIGILIMRRRTRLSMARIHTASYRYLLEVTGRDR